MVQLKVSLIISNKEAVGDYEAKSLQRDFKLREKIKSTNYSLPEKQGEKKAAKGEEITIKTSDILSVSTAKVLDFYIDSKSIQGAKKEVLELARESKVYLSMVNQIEVSIKPAYHLTQQELLLLLHCK